MKPPKVRPFDSLLVDARRGFGFDVRSVWESGLLRQLIRLVGAGGRVCLLPDQHARKTGVITQFLGQPARTHKGPAFVALKAERARLLVAVDTRIDDGPQHVCYLRELTHLEPSGDRRGDVERLTQRINDAMGEIIEKHPGSYLWHHRRWRDLPSATP
jgi:KDO2-lipid IV(A) lauroyltransferase